MSRGELVLALAGLMLAAYATGWATAWLYHRFTRVSRAEIDELDRMAEALHAAEEARDRALTYQEHREAELTDRLSRTEAELEAAMAGLREARAEAEDLRRYIAENSTG